MATPCYRKMRTFPLPFLVTSVSCHEALESSTLRFLIRYFNRIRLTACENLTLKEILVWRLVNSKSPEIADHFWKFSLASIAI